MTMMISRQTATRKAHSNTLDSNVRRCHCSRCGCSLGVGMGTGYNTKQGVKYICNDCKERLYNMASYHSNARNGFTIMGTTKIGAIERWRVGVELEGVELYNINSIELLIMLEDYGFLESDCTVSWELPTKVQNGLNGLSKLIWHIEREGFLPIFNNDNCGAHIHVECNKVDYIRRYYHSIFLPLANYIDDMGTIKRIEVFGSDFRGYACMINENSIATSHSNIFNTQHQNTLEFRLPRITGVVYVNVIKFWREVVAYINNTDLHPNGDATTRKKYARECGEHLVTIARKYFD